MGPVLVVLGVLTEPFAQRLTGGMVCWWRPTACERAAQWISLELDGELSVLERAALTRHLRRCDRCRVSSSELARVAALLREAPQVAPERPVVLAAPRSERVRRRRRAAMAFVATVAVAAVAVGSFQSPGKPPASALGFENVKQQREFAAMHVVNEVPGLDAYSIPVPPLSLGWRALR
jgi:anti-sigma factor RsiW